MQAFAAALPKIRARTSADLAKAGLPREKVLATVVQLLEKSLIRVGNEEYAKTNGSFGLTTMRDQHVDVRGSTLRFVFRGKSGKRHSVGVDNRRLARIVKAMPRSSGVRAVSVRRRERTAAGCGFGRCQCVPARDHSRRVHRKRFSNMVRHRSGGHGPARVREAGLHDSSEEGRGKGDRSRGRCVGKHPPAVCRKFVHPSGGHDAYMTARWRKPPVEAIRKSCEPGRSRRAVPPPAVGARCFAEAQGRLNTLTPGRISVD